MHWEYEQLQSYSVCRVCIRVTRTVNTNFDVYSEPYRSPCVVPGCVVKPSSHLPSQSELRICKDCARVTMFCTSCTCIYGMIWLALLE